MSVCGSRYFFNNANSDIDPAYCRLKKLDAKRGIFLQKNNFCSSPTTFLLIYRYLCNNSNACTLAEHSKVYFIKMLHDPAAAQILFSLVDQRGDATSGRKPDWLLAPLHTEDRGQVVEAQQEVQTGKTTKLTMQCHSTVNLKKTQPALNFTLFSRKKFIFFFFFYWCKVWHRCQSALRTRSISI